ncbi:MAG: hypothetical protein N2045_07015 [Fimbriimonadales bacterium]|jgi:quinol monooxygenase YgiN|nr:hypothetical protein [Fimbriimonadales bacterium]GBC91458.1 hypothetical protein HRbin14_02229 [bacterium HR14]
MGQQAILSEQTLGRALSSLWGSIWRMLRRWILKLADITIIHTTQDGVEIAVKPGKKPQSSYDFVVQYKEPGKRWRTPKHVHLVVELYVKEAYNRQLTHQLRDHLLWVFDKVKPITEYPPALQVYDPAHAARFRRLDDVGEFGVEFLLVVSELIFIQEKTNYPDGSLTYELYRDFGQKDRFSVIHKATYRG